MRLPWHRARLPEDAFVEARAARDAGREHLAQVRERDSDVREVAEALREVRRSNHFSERLAAMLRDEPRGHHAPNP